MQSFSVFILVRMLIDEGGCRQINQRDLRDADQTPLSTTRSAPAVKISALMPRMIDYTTVLDQLTREGFKSLYFNSGAFGFPPGVETFSRGWIGEPDRSIRESALALVRQVCEAVRSKPGFTTDSGLAAESFGHRLGDAQKSLGIRAGIWKPRLDAGSTATTRHRLAKRSLPLNNAPGDRV